MLKGDNKIICSAQGHFGIHSTSGTLTITGDGTLDIASARDCIQTGKIVVDGAKVHLAGFSGLFARLGETVLQNGVDVTLENAGNGYAGVYGENGVHVKDSTLRAAGSFEESYAVTSPAEIVLDNANVKAESNAENAKQVMAAPNITLTIRKKPPSGLLRLQRPTIQRTQGLWCIQRRILPRWITAR